jgi:hypothetical protein
MRFCRSILLSAVVLVPVSVPSFAQNIATVAVDVNTLGKLIPGDFDGFSTQFSPSIENTYRGEASSPIHVLGGATNPNRVFYQLMKNLGGGTLRSVDGYVSETCWNSSEAPHPDACPFAMTDDFVNGYTKASAETGWGILVAINLAQNSAPWATQFGARFAKSARATPGSKLLGFEIGNEPDLYAKQVFFGRTAIRPPEYSWRDLVNEWKPYIAAFKSNPDTAGIPLIGPAYGGGWADSALGPFIDSVGAGNLGFVTAHHYATNRCEGQTVTIAELLSQDRMDEFESKARDWVATVNRRGLDLVHGESNSVACEGQKGVSDSFASAVWGLDWLFSNFNVGMRRINFLANNSYYSPVFVTTAANPDDDKLTYLNFVAPLYYAMYTFSTQAQNKHTLPTTIKTAANIKAYAVRETSGGAVIVFLINKDLKASGKVVITPSARMGQGSLLTVQASSLDSKLVRFGGVSFDNNTGLLAGLPTTTPISSDPSGNYSIDLANASIAVVTVAP